jgi:O-antigen ligase
VVRFAATACTGESLVFRMKAGVITTTVAVSIATFGLSFTVGSKPLLSIMVAGAFLYAVLLTGNRSWTVHALLFATFLPMPPGSSLGFRGGGYFIFYYECFVVLSLLYAIGLLRASPVAAKRLRNSAAVWAALIFGITVAVGLSVGLARGYSFYDIQTDARPVVTMMIIIFVAAVIFAVNDWRRYVKTITAILMIAAAWTVYSSATGTPLGPRTETAELTASDYHGQPGGDVLSGGSTALRYLTQTTNFALAVLLGCVTLLVLGRVTAKQAAPMLIPSLVISFLGFSRNTNLALVGTLVFALVIALVDGHLLRAVLRFVSMALVAGVAIFGLSILGHAIGAGDWIDAQVVGYANRVVAGSTHSTRDVDASTRNRLEEDMYIKKSGAEHQIFGGGFGYRYKPSEGPRGTFFADRGTLYAHNTYGWFYVKTGVVGAGTFLILIVAGVLPALGRHRSSPVLAAAAATLVGLSVAMVVMPLPIDLGYNAVGLGLVVGACLGAGTVRATRALGLRQESQPPTLTISPIGGKGHNS